MAFIRWLVFVPVGLFLGIVLTVLTTLFQGWALDSVRFWILIAFLGGFTFLWFIGLAQYGIAYLSLGMICPNGKIGVPIYLTIFGLGIFNSVLTRNWGTSGYFNFLYVVNTLIYIAGQVLGALAVYHEKKENLQA